MRMTHYFAGMAVVAVPALLWTAWTGILGERGRHVPAGLFTAIFTTAAHSLLILFMIVTGRVLKEAMRARPLGPEFLAELNRFFARKSAYPAALVAVLLVATAAVLGYAPRGFGISPAWHMGAGIAALAFNLWAFSAELRALRENQTLIDRAAAELDRLDREEVAPREASPEPDVRSTAARLGLTLAIGAWFPYLYWSLIVWKGRFEQVPLWPWLALSLAGAVVHVAARKRR